MNDADGFFPERLILRQRMACPQIGVDPVEFSGIPVGGTPSGEAVSPSRTLGGSQPWLWFVILMPTWIGGGAGWHFSRRTALILKDSLVRDIQSAGLDALVGLGLGLTSLGVYLTFKAWATDKGTVDRHPG